MSTLRLDPTLISDEKLAKLQEILATVGMPDPDHYGFSRHVRYRESYMGGSMEWSERSENMRFYFYARANGPIYRAEVYVLNGGSHHSYSSELIAQANAQLEELFAN